MRKLVLLAPLSVFLLISIYFAIGLTRDPARIPSVLVNKPLPAFSLAPISGREGERLESAALKGEITLLNVFASWCVGCAIEHPVLMEVAKSNDVQLVGLNWKDKPGDGASWLKRYGDPYSAVGNDFDGRVAIDLGVTGAPETFIIDKQGVIRYKQVGPITEQIWELDILPVIAELKAEGS